MLHFSKARNDQTPWSYPTTPKKRRIAGAFRAIAVDPLLVDAPNIPRIDLWEWSKITYKLTQRHNLMRNLRYAAFSHVWSNGVEVNQTFQATKPSDRLKVMISGPPGFKEISWDGLIQAARAARFKKAKYFWVDFLCLDQQDAQDQEKELQIALMASIYRSASWVIIMVAGIVAVGAVNHHSPWIDRAWTLQEAILNSQQGKQTYIYVQWPPIYPLKFKGEGGRTITFYQVNGNDCLITFRDMCTLADTDLGKMRLVPPPVTILNSQNPGSGDVPRRVLYAAAFAPKKAREAAMWRSMYLRQSTNPVDMVYSLMGCLGINIDPYRNYRSPAFLFNDLARKAAVSPAGPAWLTICGVKGSRIGRDHDMSRLIPQFPKTESDRAPFFVIKNKKVSVAQYIDSSANYIEKYDIKFVTQSHPHIISAKMLKITAFKRLKSRKRGAGSIHQGKASMSFGRIHGTCFYRGYLNEVNFKKSVFAAYVGDVGDMGIPGRRADQAGNKYFLFLQWTTGRSSWQVIADGTFRKKGGPTWTPGKERWLFTIGKGAQKNEMMWLQDQSTAKLTKWLRTEKSVDANDIRTKRFQYHNYGFTPLSNINTDDDEKNSRFKWVGYQYKGPVNKPFQRYSFNIDTNGVEGLDDVVGAFGKPDPIKYVACSSLRGTTPPKDLKSARERNIKVSTLGSIKVDYVYSNWKVSIQGELGRDRAPGIRVPEPMKNGMITVSYWIKVQFGSRAVYFTIKQAKNTRPEFHQVFIYCYAQHGGRRLNHNMESGRGKFA